MMRGVQFTFPTDFRVTCATNTCCAKIVSDNQSACVSESICLAQAAWVLTPPSPTVPDAKTTFVGVSNHFGTKKINNYSSTALRKTYENMSCHMSQPINLTENENQGRKRRKIN